MRTVRVLVLVAMGVSAVCGFAQDGTPGTSAPAGGPVMLNRTKAVSAKQEIVPADKYRLRPFRRLWRKAPARILSRQPRA